MGSLVTAVYGSAFAQDTLIKAVELTAAISAAMVIAMAMAIVMVLKPARVAA